MAARKNQKSPEPAEVQPDPDSADTGPGDIAVDESFADSGPATPTGHVRVRGEDDDRRPRAAGHVLTEKGWVRE